MRKNSRLKRPKKYECYFSALRGESNAPSITLISFESALFCGYLDLVAVRVFNINVPGPS